MRQNYNCNTTMSDLLFNMLLAFVAMFVLAFSLASQQNDPKDTNAKISGQYMIELTWNDESDDDVDLWVEGPGGLVFYRQRETGNMYLDRDDLGRANEVVQTAMGPVEIKNNKEIVIIRNLVPGEYIVNLFAYTIRSQPPISANVVLTRLSPWNVITGKSVVLNGNGDEKTVFRFTVGADGSVKNINDLQKRLTGINP